MTTESIYDRDPAIQDGEDLYIRASATGLCNRMLYYSAHDVPKTDGTPPDTQVLFDLGNYLEAFAKETLVKHHGWYIGEIEPLMVLLPLGDFYVTGHPDAVGNHDYTSHQNTAIEIKVRGDAMFNNVSARGNFNATPSAVYQLAVYRRGLLEAGTINPEVDCCIVTMNRDTGQIHHEWFMPHRLEEVINVLGVELSEDIDRWREGRPAHHPGAQQLPMHVLQVAHPLRQCNPRCRYYGWRAHRAPCPGHSRLGASEAGRGQLRHAQGAVRRHQGDGSGLPTERTTGEDASPRPALLVEPEPAAEEWRQAQRREGPLPDGPGSVRQLP